jgi:uncharacterized repeat protein (TIGR02543 family)
MRKEKRLRIKAFTPVLLVVLVSGMLICAGCSSGIYDPLEMPSAIPAVEAGAAAVVKTGPVQKSVEFTLSSAHTGAWKVYSAQTGGEALAGVTAAFNPETRILTLTAAEEDLPAGTYWVSVTETGKTESPRLDLTVAPYELSSQSAAPAAEAEAATVVKTESVQKSVEFTLTSAHTGAWKVYSDQTGGEALTDITVSFAGGTLILTAAGEDLPAGTYWVSVTEAGKTESSRLGLTVGPYVPASQSATPAVEAEAAAVVKTEPVQQSVEFTLTSTHTGEWKVYAGETGGEALTDITVSFTGGTLILAAVGEDLPAGTYWVSVTEAGKTESFRLGLTVGAYTPPQSDAPTAGALTAAKTSATQRAVNFALTSAHTGEWKVYAGEADGEALTNVTASFTAPNLTLTAAGEDLPAGTYWVSVTETGKTESSRLGLTVGPYVPPSQSATPVAETGALTVAKTSATQRAVSFTLTSTHTGEWKVYAGETGGEALPSVSASFTAPKLTLTAAGEDLPAGTYWVSVTETDKTESFRLGLTVGVYTPPQSATPAAGSLTVAKTAGTQRAVNFTLTTPHTGEWKVYAGGTGGEALGDVSASFTVPNLTLTAAGEDLPAGTYWVSVTETGKTESFRLGLTVGAYVPPPPSSTPTAGPLTVAKTSATQRAVSFTLTSTYTGEWKVYAGETGGEALSNVSASFIIPNLTLTAEGADLPAGTYWVSVTETGKTESSRLGLTVGAYTPPQSAAPTAEALTAVKTSATQPAVSFTLTSINSGEWKVYAGETGGEALADVSASFTAPNLTLTAEGEDLPAGTYWVSVTETDKTESSRLGLTVLRYLPATLTLGVEGDTITAKTDTNVSYTVTPTGGVSAGTVNGYGVVNFAAAGDYIDLIQTPAREYLPRDAWTMEMYVKTVSGAGSNTDFLQFWNTRGDSPTFRVELPNWLFITHSLNGAKRIGAGALDDAWRHIAIVKSGNDLTVFVNGTQTAASDGYGNFNTAAFAEVTTSAIGVSRTGGTQLYNYIVHNRALEAADFSGAQTVVDNLNRITVTFNANGGAFSETGSPPTKTVDIFRPANTVALPSAPVNEGKIFAGWFLNAEGSGEAFIGTTPVTDNTTVYAKWSDEPVQYEVTFDAYFGAFPDNESAKMVTVTSPNPVGDPNMPPEPALKGFTFSGWYAGKSDTDWGTEFTASSDVIAHTTVYAKWVWDDSLNINSITYTVNGEDVLEGTLSDGSAYSETFMPTVVTGDGTIETVNGLKAASGSRYDFGPQAGAFFSKTDWTLEFYVLTTGTGNSPNPLVFSRLDNDKNYGGIWIENPNLYFIVRETTGSVRTQTNASMSTNTWHHVAYVKTSSDDNKILVYVDGVALAQGSNPSFNALTSNAYFKSLFHNYFGASYLKFYKFALYSRAWNTDDITNAMSTLSTLNGGE